jgi:hypothetical protein
MTLPNASMEIEDFGLGVIEAGDGGKPLVIGVCLGGTNYEVNTFGSKQAAENLLIAGPALEAVVSKLAAGASQVTAVRAKNATQGTVGSVTHTGTGTGTVTPSAAPQVQVLAKVTTGGALATAYIAFSVDGGEYGTPQLTTVSSFVYDVPDTFLRITFPAGTYVLNEVYTFATSGAISQSGAGPLPTKSVSPVDAYEVIVEITTAGALGVGEFKYSLDGGDAYSGEIQIPSGGVYVIPDTGVVLTFSGTFVAADTYSFSSTHPSYSTTELALAQDAANESQAEFDIVHVVGTPSSASAAATVFATVATKMDEAEAAFRYARAIMECPSSESDATVAAAFASLASSRVGVACGDFEHASPLTGRTLRRNAAWAVTARAGAIAEAEAVHWVGRGALRQVSSLHRDEGQTPALDAARFLTLRTYPGFAGYYVTRGRLMAQAGSDFTLLANGRVMDRACTIARSVLLPLVGQDVEVDSDTGYIVEADAAKIEKRARRAIEADLLARKQVSAVQVVVARDTNVLSTQALDVEIGLIPRGYSDYIRTKLRFVNPALAA